MLFLHLITNLFLAGRSDFKPYFFIVWMVVVTFVFKVFSQKKEITKTLQIIGFMLILSAYLFPAHLWIQKAISYSIDPLAYTVTYSSDDFSSSSLIHNHIAKSAFSGIGYSLINKNNIDAGSGYSWLISSNEQTVMQFFIVGSTLFLIFLILYSQKYSWSQSFVIAIITSIIAKNMVDGGIFNYETGSALLALGYVLRNSSATLISRGSMILGSVSIISGIFFALESGSPSYIRHLLFSGIAIATLVLCSQFLNSHRLTILQKNLVAGSALIIIIGLTFFRGANLFSYAYTLAESPSFVTAPCDSIAALSLTNEPYVLNSLCFGKLTAEYASTSLKTIIDDISIPLDYRPLKVGWNQCIPSGLPGIQELKIVSPQLLNSNVATSSFSTASLTSIRSRSFGSTGILTVSVHPCSSLYENIIQQSLVSLNVQQAIIIPSALRTPMNDLTRSGEGR